jgi:hypothetical protein
MADIVNSLFGIDPAALQQQRAATDFAQAYKFAQLDPFERANMALYQSGAGIARGAGQLLGGDEQLNRATKIRELSSQFDMTSADGLRQFAQAVAQVAPDVAQQAVRRADEILTTGLKQAELQTQAIRNMSVATKEKLGTPENQAEQAYYNNLLTKYPDTVEGRALAADAFAKWKTAQKSTVAAAGATVMPGEAKIPDLRTAQSLVNDYLGKSKENLSTVKTIQNYGEMIKAGNSSQLPQFQRSLVKLVGDSQIGQNELKNILGSGGIAADIVDGVAKFITGAPSNAKIDDVLKGVAVLQRQVEASYTAGQKQARDVLSASKFDKTIVDNLVGPALKTATPAGAGKKQAPPLTEWLTLARQSNPNVSDAELTTFYNQKYGKSK